MRARILNASAGSGKTYQLAYKYVRDVVEQPGRYRHILAVTFTNKATEEMKSRILQEIHALASDAPSGYLALLVRELGLDERTVRLRAAEARSRILHDYSRFTVLTIDTFFQRILRSFIRELGLDLNYNVEIETASVLQRSADTLVERITDDQELRRWLMAFVEERIEDGRRWDVRDGILALGGELFKEKNKEALAAARTKAELGRIVGAATGKAEAARAAMRRTARQAMELMAAAGVAPEDFAGKSRSFARYFAAVAAGETKAPTATARKMALSTEGWCAKGSPAEALAPELRPLLAALCETYDRNIRLWNTADLLRENYRGFALLADLYETTQRMCDEQNMMLLSETKYLLSEFVARNDAPFIYEKIGNRFERFMIDEFQDTSVKEWENFLPLLQNAMAQSEGSSVLLVGDIKQSIYRWRGGDWRILHERAQQALGPASTEVVHLQENYRSLPVVVEFNNRLIGAAAELDNARLNELLDTAPAGTLPDAMRTRLRDTLRDAYEAHTQIPRKRGSHPGCVRITITDDEPPLVARIRELLDLGFRPCDLLVLVRGKTDAARVAAMLLDFKRNNDDPRYRFDVMTQEALSVGYAPVSSLVAAAFRLALDPGDDIARAIHNRHLERPFDTRLSPGEIRFFDSLRLLSPEEAFERIVMRYDLQHDTRQIAYLQAVHEQVIAFSSSRIADIALFLAWWEQQGQHKSLRTGQSESAIEIMTVHKAKGLEKRVVLIPYCNWQLTPKAGGQVANIVWAEAADPELKEAGRFPVRYRKEMAESLFSAEYYREMVYSHVDNVNLLYVALTRAAESLHLFIPRSSAFSAQTPNVGSLVMQCIRVEEDRALAGDLEGVHTQEQTTEEFRFGEFAGPEPLRDARTQVTSLRLSEYPTARAELRLRLPSDRYFADGEPVELSPRNYGILLHRVFEQATTTAEIKEAIRAMTLEGSLDEQEAGRLRRMVAQALGDPLARSWFDGSWDCVRNEQTIVVPGETSVRRPDRVMTRGDRAVVVDYKFGELQAARYRTQIGSYMLLLRQMGYTDVEGYLWYVKLGRTEKVEI